ncbi:MAG: T9SS type A sorting domain-containing protein [Candidatus Marinimicrobia bacterium]|nr:T9SS type A sorting domain-containing protein [Candidatus Neomarinimicrobiota bacterium]
MKQYSFLPIIFFMGIITIGQIDPDWVFREIEMKQAALQNRRELLKPTAKSGQYQYDVGFYGIDLKIDIDNEEISGQVNIRGKSKINALSVIELDLMSPLIVDSVWNEASGFQQSGDDLSIQLQAPVDSGQVFEVGIQYGGSPVAAGLKGFSFAFHDNVPIVSTLSEPYYARGWFPCKDIPSDKADSADISLTVPDSLVAISNGLLKSILDNNNGTKTYKWQERYPIATYLISLAVTNYDLIEQTYTAKDGTTMPVQHWYYPEDESRIDVLLLTTEMISFFSDIWGEYPFINEKYGHARFSWGGGMEHQTCTSLGSYSELMVCHELAHQWWGDMVTCANWSEIWLNEGFARYSEALWEEYKNGSDGYRDYMAKINRPEYWQSGPVYILDTTNVSSIFNLLVYDKGAWILHMLRGVVGDSVFQDIFPAYREKYYMDVATTEGFKQICEKISGEDLDWFFNQWVYGSGQPDYKIRWGRKKTTANNWQMTLWIDQTQSATNLFQMPMAVKVEFSDRDSMLIITDSLASQSFGFQFSEMPENVFVDPENWILKTIQYSMIDPDIGYLPDKFLLTNPYPNPFNAGTYFDIYLPYDTDSRIVVYDMNGRLVETIAEGLQRSGYRELVWQPENLPSGVYFIRLENSWVELSKKVVYLK